MSTESDKPTPRQERYGGERTNGVYENNFLPTAPEGSVTCVVEFWLCRKGVWYFYVTAK